MSSEDWADWLCEASIEDLEKLCRESQDSDAVRDADNELCRRWENAYHVE